MNELGPEMTAEGWRHMDAEVGRESEFDGYFWCHPPSSRVVSIDMCKRSGWVGPVWGSEPASHEMPGYCVTLRVHDEWGNPVRGDGFWIESFGHAVKLGRELRRHVLGERGMPRPQQLTLDDASASANRISTRRGSSRSSICSKEWRSP